MSGESFYGVKVKRSITSVAERTTEDLCSGVLLSLGLT